MKKPNTQNEKQQQDELKEIKTRNCVKFLEEKKMDKTYHHGKNATIHGISLMWKILKSSIELFIHYPVTWYKACKLRQRLKQPSHCFLLIVTYIPCQFGRMLYPANAGDRFVHLMYQRHNYRGRFCKLKCRYFSSYLFVTCSITIILATLSNPK